MHTRFVFVRARGAVEPIVAAIGSAWAGAVVHRPADAAAVAAWDLGVTVVGEPAEVATAAVALEEALKGREDVVVVKAWTFHTGP